MIVIASREEKELLNRLRKLEPIETAAQLSTQLVKLKRDIADAEISQSKQKEEHAREERELRHMIGLEKKRQTVEIEQAKRETTLSVREENLKAERARFEEQLKFNTQRFETMEKYLKDMMAEILGRLPTVTVDVKRGK